MVNGISEEIQQLICDYAQRVRHTHEAYLLKASKEDFQFGGDEERRIQGQLFEALAAVAQDRDCQKLEREYAERELRSFNE